MTRKDLLKSPDYWIAGIQVMLYNCAEKFMKATGKNRTQLAEHLGVTKGYVSQVLNGDYDHKLSKFVELSLAFGYVPKIEFVPLEEYVEEDSCLKDTKTTPFKIVSRDSRQDFNLILKIPNELERA